MALLVLNAGSSSLKYQLFDRDGDTPRYRGLVDRIGSDQSVHICRSTTDIASASAPCQAPSHAAALSVIHHWLHKQSEGLPAMTAIGHRVVHGGERFHRATVVDADLEQAIEALTPLAPLHNPASLAVIRQCRQYFPHLPQVAVFDTAFHHTLPERAWRYAVPDALYRRYGVRRYGFHGISHAYVARRASEYLGRDRLKIISLHLGNGASAAAIDSGRCIDTSMGLTPLEGLVMGTRGGDMDPAVIFHLARTRGTDLAELESLLTTESGLKGLCGSADMREVEALAAGGQQDAQLALELYSYRIRKYIGAYAAALGGVDAVVFTAGIGEHSPHVRAQACAELEFLGIRLDPARNRVAKATPVTAVHSDDSTVAVLIVATDEEADIAEQTRALLDLLP